MWVIDCQLLMSLYEGLYGYLYKSEVIDTKHAVDAGNTNGQYIFYETSLNVVFKIEWKK